MRTIRFALVAFLLVAGLVRFGDLGKHSLWIDEDLTRMTVDGVLEGGIPRHPSGGIYFRAPFYTYSVAFSVAVFGKNEFGLRLPSLLFSIAGLWVAFRLAREVGGNTVAFATLGVLALSGWDVHYARMARMYAPTILLFTLAVWFTYRRGVRGETSAGVWAVVCGALATTMHPLAASLAVVFLLIPVLPNGTPRRTRWAWTAALVVTAVLVGQQRLSSWLWRLDGPAAVPPALADVRVSVPGFGGLTLEKARLLLIEALPQGVVGVLLGIGLVAILAGVVFAIDRKSRSTSGSKLSVVAWAAAAGINMPAVAALAGAWWVRSTAGTRGEAIRRLLRIGAATAVVLLALLAITLLVGGAGALASKRAVFEILGVPTPWWRELALAFPVMFVVVLVGSLLIFLDSFEAEDDGTGLFVVGSFWAPLILMGFVESAYVQLRYLIHLNPIFVVLFVLSLRRIGRFLSSSIPRFAGFPGTARSGLTRGAVLAVVALLLADQSSPREAWGASHLDYGRNDRRVKNPDIRSHYYYDTKSTGEYVARAIRPADVVIARDGPATLVYAGRVDYVLRKNPYDGIARSKAGEIVDRNVGVPVLDSVEKLERVLESHKRGAIWIVASVPDGNRPIVNLPPGVPEWLKAREDRVVFVGRDGITRIYRFEPDAPAED